MRSEIGRWLLAVAMAIAATVVVARAYQTVAARRDRGDRAIARSFVPWCAVSLVAGLVAAVT